MPRRTRLELVNERPALDPDAMAAAEAALGDAERGYPLASSEDVIAALRAESAQKERIAAAAIEQANQMRGRAEAAEARNAAADTEAAQIRATAQAEIDKAQQAALAHVTQAQRQAQAANAAVAAVGVAAKLGQGIAYLVERAPVLFSLVGAFVLGRAMLPAPTPDQLALLAIYGSVAVAPAVWLARRR